MGARVCCFALGSPSSHPHPTVRVLAALQLAKLTVPVLKAYLKSVGVRPATKKAELLEMVETHLGSQQGGAGGAAADMAE